MTYKKIFQACGMANQVEAWLDDNPPPDDWRSTPFAWAYTEMPLSKEDRIKLRVEFRNQAGSDSKLFNN